MTTQEISELKVIDGALELFRKPGGYTGDSYFVSTDDESYDEPGDAVISACAIGGIEQSLWRLSGVAVSEFVRQQAKQSKPTRSKDEVKATYNAVMLRVNRITRKLYPKDDVGEDNNNVEHITFYGTRAAQRRRVLRVFETAREELVA